MRRYKVEVRIEDDVNVNEVKSIIDQFISDLIDIETADNEEERSNVINGNGIISRKQTFKGVDRDDIEINGEIMEREALRSGHVISYTVWLEAWEE